MKQIEDWLRRIGDFNGVNPGERLYIEVPPIHRQGSLVGKVPILLKLYPGLLHASQISDSTKSMTRSGSSMPRRRGF